jgi:hypothetical protein
MKLNIAGLYGTAVYGQAAEDPRHICRSMSTWVQPDSGAG